MSTAMWLKEEVIPRRLRRAARSIETPHGTLALIWAVRFVFLLFLFAAFYGNTTVRPSEQSVLALAFIGFFGYMVAAGGLGFYKPSLFERPLIKLGQVAIEVSIYSLFYYLTHNPRSDIYLFYFLPLFVAARYLGSWWAALTLVWASLGLGTALYSMTLTGTEIAWTVYPVRIFFLVCVTVLYIVRRRPAYLDEIREEAEGLVTAFQDFEDGVFVVDQDNRLLVVNTPLRAKHGDLYDGEMCWDYFHCPERPCLGCPAQADTQAPAGSSKRTTTFIDQQGHPYPVDISSVPLPNLDGAVIGSLAVVRDVSRTRETEQRLRRYADYVERQVQGLTHERARWLATLVDLSQHLAGPMDLDDLEDLVVEATRSRLQAETGALFLLRDSRLRREAIAGVERDWFNEESYGPGDGLTAQAFWLSDGSRYGKVIRNNNIDASSVVIPSHLAAYKAKLGTHQVKHLLAVPLNGRTGSFGVLRVVNKLDSQGRLDPAGFSQDDEDFLVFIASLVAMAMENARLLQQSQRQVAELDRQNQVAQAVTSSLDMHAVLRNIKELVRQMSGADHTAIVLVREDGAPMDSLEDPDIEAGLARRIRPEGVTSHIIAHRCSRNFDQVTDDGQHNDFVVQHSFRSYCGVPIMVRDRVLAVLYVHSNQPAAFRDKVDALYAFANQATIAIAIQNAIHYREAQQRLTMLQALVRMSEGLMNHLHLDELSQFCAREAGDLFNVEDCSILVRHDGSQTLDLIASSGIPQHLWTQRQASLDGLGLPAWVARTGETLNFGGDDYMSHLAWGGQDGEPYTEHLQHLPSGKCHSLLIGPLRDSNGAVIGVLKLENRCGDGANQRFPDFEVALQATVASLIGLAIERARLFHQLDREARRKARESLGEDIHHVMNVVHGALILKGAYIKGLWDKGEGTEARRQFDKLVRAATNVHAELRRLHEDVRDPILEEKGLIPALHHFAQLLMLRPVFYPSPYQEPLPMEVEYALYKIGQAALNNIAHHARGDGAGHAEIKLGRQGGAYEFIVRDTGPGFDVRAKRGRSDSFGLQSMERWAKSIGGRLEIVSGFGKGTTIRVSGHLQEVHHDRRNPRSHRR